MVNDPAYENENRSGHRGSVHPAAQPTEPFVPLARHATLGILCHKLHFVRHGDYYTTGGFADFVDGLGAHFGRIVLVVPVASARRVQELRKVAYQRCLIHPLWGPTQRTAIAWLMRAYIRRQVRHAFASCDLVNVGMFHMISLIAAPQLERMRKPIFFSLTGQPYARTGKRGFRARLVRRMGVTLRRHLTFVHGRHLAEAYKLVPSMCASTYSSTFHPSDIGTEPIPPPGSDDPIRLIFVGRLDKDKGVDVLLDALGSTGDLRRRFHLDVLGDGPARSSLQQAVRRSGPAASVTFHGNVPHGDRWEGLMSSAHALVLPSLHEGLPKAVTEALRFGLPVLATRVGAIPTVIEDKINGWLVEPGKVEPIVDALRTMSAMQPPGWTAMSQANLRLAERYTIENASREMVQTLFDHGLLRKGPEERDA